MREDEYTEFKKTTGELNEAMVSISSILNKSGLRSLIQRYAMFPERFSRRFDRRSSLQLLRM